MNFITDLFNEENREQCCVCGVYVTYIYAHSIGKHYYCQKCMYEYLDKLEEFKDKQGMG